MYQHLKTPRIVVGIACLLSLIGGLQAQTSDPTLMLPEGVPDPLERTNRMIWEFNRVANRYLGRPVGRAYRFLVRQPVRKRVSNVASNLTYPKRFVNNTLTGNWSGARDETYRFLLNSTVGVGGVFHASDHWDIPQSNLGFGDTLSHYGMGPGIYLVLPLLGPTNVRDGVGRVGDRALDPLAYFPDLRYARTAFGVNTFSDRIETIDRFTESEPDAYQNTKAIYDYRQRRDAPRLLGGPQHEPSLETMKVIYVRLRDPKFPERREDATIKLQFSGKRLDYTYWLQKHPAPVVYVLPGLAAHRLSSPSIALAEMAYRKGLSVVVLSSAYHSEFIHAASSTALPGHTPTDSMDVHRAILEIDRQLRDRHRGRLGKRAVMGYSMGAFHALTIAAAEQPAYPETGFWRYIAISPPVRLTYAADQLDSFYNAPLAWPENERLALIDNTFLKAVRLSSGPPPNPQSAPPFNSIESRFLVGYVFRTALRDIIFASQSLNNLGILETPLRDGHRQEAYAEIAQYSFKDYFEQFAARYFYAQDMIRSQRQLGQVNDLRNYAGALANNPRTRVIINRNDFITSRNDIRWLQRTFRGDRLTMFSKGGHLGNLGSDQVRQAVEAHLEDLLDITSSK